MNDKAEISIVAKAVPYDSPALVSPNKMFNMAVFTMFGLLLGAGLAFLLELLNSTVKNEEDIENGLELPILGNVLYTKPKKGQAVRLVNGVIGKDQSF
ncbi:hypothetical protein QKW52_11880 [Bacillus sonorensis]|nr:hypothetical protein [Bacillus sonorensis]